MRNTTLNNFRMRYKWLERALSKEVNISKSEILGIASMRDFCKLSVSDWFSPIALNTLKKAASEPRHQLHHIDSWSGMKTMRAQLFARHTPKSNDAMAPQLPSDKAQAKLALLDAHINAMAYFDLYNFLLLLAEHSSSDPKEILGSIQLKLKTSKAKYHSFLIGHELISSTSLQVIKGGK